MDSQPPRGFRDLLPPSSGELGALEADARAVFERFGFSEIRIPTVESLALFAKTTGETSDIVQKEMFAIQSEQLAEGAAREEAGDRLALRPEGTPGVVRAYLHSGLVKSKPNQRLFYIGGMFRHERPQKGRYREFVQIGAEWLGVASAASDAEMIAMTAALVETRVAKDQYRVQLNTIGDEQCRPAYRVKLVEYLSSAAGTLCADCQRRLAKNPMRIFDCKTDGKRVREQAPKLAPCAPCGDHFKEVKSLLKAAGIAFEEDPFLVRGLDYYTRTVFEFRVPTLGAQDAVAAGGRYDGLVAQMGGPQTPATGWALGAERLLLAAEGSERGRTAVPDVFVAFEGTSERAFRLLDRLRRAGLKSVSSAGEKALRTQLKDAEFLKAAHVVVVKDEGALSLKSANGAGGEQLMGEDQLIGFLKDTRDQ